MGCPSSCLRVSSDLAPVARHLLLNNQTNKKPTMALAKASAPAPSLVNHVIQHGVAPIIGQVAQYGLTGRLPSTSGTASNSAAKAANSEGPNQKIIHPTVPKKEEDPRVRINVMIGIFNANLPPHEPPSKIDLGFYHEIQTAILLVRQYKITHGNQISRPLTAAEKKSLQKGNSQMILVPMEGNNYRELDIVYEEGRGEEKITYIVEAKNKAGADASQLKPNLDLAQKVKGKVIYALEGTAQSKDNALKDAHQKLSTAGEIPPLDVIHLPSENFAQLYFNKNVEARVAGLGEIPTLEAILDPAFNPDHGGEHPSVLKIPE